MKATKQNPHAWFFSYVTGLEGYDKSFAKIIREGIVLEFSGGVTGSLSELHANYPELYRKMKAEIQTPKSFKKPVQVSEELDKARKRLIAVLFAFLSPHPLRDFPHTGEGVSIHYVKATACQASNVKDFNDIPLSKLKSLYRTFGTKNTKGMTELDRELIWAGLRKENQN